MQSPLNTQTYKLQPNNTNLKHIKGSDGYPLVGNALGFVKDVLKATRNQVEKYGEISRFALGPQTGLMIVGADNYKRIFIDKDKNFSTQMGYAEQLGIFYEGGLLLHDFDEHRVQRRIMQNAFKFSTMRNYVDALNHLQLKHIRSWQTEKEQAEIQIVFYPLIKQALLEVGSHIFLGVEDFNDEADMVNQAFLNVSGGLSSVLRWNYPGGKFNRGLKGKQTLHKYLASQIPLRRKGTGDDMLSLMTRETDENGQFFSDLEIIQHTAFLLFAAHDTTTSVLTHMMMYLGQDPELQQHLREESLAIGKSRLEYDDLDRLQGIEHCFFEVLRLHPPVPLMTRRTIVETELGGHMVPANTMLFLPTSYNHRDARYWTNPEQFDPRRFAPGREEQKNHSFCFHPFGGGAHKCIGMHFAMMLSKCFLHQFLLNYQFETPPDYSPDLDWVPIPKPADGVPLNLTAIG